MNHKPATIEYILNGPKPKPKPYRRVIVVPNGKHSPTYQVIESDTPPSKKDVAFKSAHNRQGMPTGC